jgi:hypothetical protein
MLMGFRFLHSDQPEKAPFKKSFTSAYPFVHNALG